MGGVLFFSDIDNTLIYSRKHPHDGWICVEWIHEEEQAYMSPQTIENLIRLNSGNMFIPVTSRSVQQYKRICFPQGSCPMAAITTNGAELLIDGKQDEEWHHESAAMIRPYVHEMERQYLILSEMDCFIRCRMVDSAYLFVYTGEGVDPKRTADEIGQGTSLRVFASGRKIYLLPPPINKGIAVKRFMERLGIHKSIAAGDSKMDLPMLESADDVLIPEKLRSDCLLYEKIHVCPEDRVFSEYVTMTAMQLSGR